ncbi:MAG: ribose 5-phosphate isomerase B [Rhodospirillaceae bacterium]|jgi:ribose 5-phosphate isomerase B|nr:ribose 5-phosphate isomerase B [Rhodospirillaceae bacterium]MBT3910879.1 ribose 5-phosphate isomerase B [Rhodospirillaceae bacterium]MBT5299519.1 ribose 5-phosphate isomerase B [Rhodospirillaceae bacterium]MBT5513921.1 ribose 5-phosphate isomerase B [Rhodospirillaceae bacterium]MBT6085894.1 ribose 5-phosphate isomerase B [Rhodospirillaceae bacterium]
MSQRAVAIACDHAGFQLKSKLKEQLVTKGIEVIDLGTDSEDSVDYPDFGFAMAKALSDDRAETGVLVCGSGIGISMAANRHPDVRAALVHDALGARMSRLHNDANVICFGGRMIGEEVAMDCLNIFLETDFEGGRHARRVGKLGQPG